MDYNNLFIKELNTTLKNRNSSELPQNIYECIKANVIEEAKDKCNGFKGVLKKRVNQGDFENINGKNIVKYKHLFKYDYFQLRNLTKDVEWYLLESENANRLLANGVFRFTYDGVHEFNVEWININKKIEDEQYFIGYKNIYKFEIQKTSFTDMYLDALKENLRKNNIDYRIMLEFTKIDGHSKKESTVKSYCLTFDIPNLHESFQTQRIIQKDKADRFNATISIELSVSF